MKTLHITKHAIIRFQQRFESGPNDVARAGVEAMVSEARGLSLEEISALSEYKSIKGNTYYMLHEYSRMLICVEVKWGTATVVTLFRAPTCLMEGAAA